MNNKKEKASIKDVWKSVKRTFKQAFKISKKEIIILIILIVISALIPLANAYLSSRIIDELVELVENGQDSFSQTLIYLAVFTLGLSLFETLINTLYTYFNKQNFYNLGRFFTFAFLQKASDLDLYHYEDPKKNDLIQKARDSYSWRPQSFVEQMIRIVSDVVKIISTFTVILFLSPIFFVIIIISTIPALLISTRTSSGVWNIWGAKAEVRRKFGESSWVLSNETSLMELRIFKTKNYLFNMITGLFDNFFITENKANQRKSLYDSLGAIFAKVGIFTFIVYSIHQVLVGNISVGEFTFFSAAVFRFAGSLSDFFNHLGELYDHGQYMVDYYKFLDLENVIKSGNERLTDKNRSPLIEFNNVKFSYPSVDKPVLNGINLRIEPGEKIALVGENGSGKTTLIKLLCRFYDVTEGQIFIDGKDIRSLNIDEWYSQIGVLFQNFVYYQFLAAKETIGVGDIENLNNLERIKEAAVKSGADDFISSLKNGYENILSKHFPDGTDLSGGQWQRIALARAFFRNAPILILDEPTSAIDAKAESEIFDKLYEFSSGKTVIIISHRFSTVRKADKIYVMDKGEIIESGTHDELIKKNGKYKFAFEVQAKGYK